jgi:hypothetical protein
VDATSGYLSAVGTGRAFPARGQSFVSLQGAHLAALLEEVREAAKPLDLKIEWVSRNENAESDALTWTVRRLFVAANRDRPSPLRPPRQSPSTSRPSPRPRRSRAASERPGPGGRCRLPSWQHT